MADGATLDITPVTKDVGEAIVLIADRCIDADQAEVPGLTAALECVLSPEATPAHEIVEAIREAAFDDPAVFTQEQRDLVCLSEGLRVGDVFDGPHANPTIVVIEDDEDSGHDLWFAQEAYDAYYAALAEDDQSAADRIWEGEDHEYAEYGTVCFLAERGPVTP